MQKKMDEYASSGAKLLRLFRKLLLSKGKHTQGELAKYLNCSPQTVIRLISEIESEVGANLETGKDKNKRWYSLSPDTKNMLGLDNDELRCLSLCRQLAEPYLTDDDRKRADNILLKISMLLSDLNLSSEKKQNYSFYSKGRIDYSLFIDSIHDLEKALSGKYFCRLRYRKPNTEEISLISFVPVQFVCQSNALYILGAKTNITMNKVEKLVSLAVHRILSVVVTESISTFKIESSDLRDFGLPWDKEYKTFEIRIRKGRASNYIKERLWCDNQILEELPSGDLVLTFKTRSSPEVFAWCRSFGDQILSVKTDGSIVENLQAEYI